MVAVTCRTEYLTPRHEWGARGAWITLLVGMVAFIALGIADADGSTTAAVVFGAVALSLAFAAWGRLGARGAILLSVDDETVTFGNESGKLTSYPVSALVTLTKEGPAASTSTSGRQLTVEGLKFVELEFADATVPGGVSELWQIAVVDTDPAAVAVIERLRPARPKKVRVKKESVRTQAAASEPYRFANRPAEPAASFSPPATPTRHEQAPVDSTPVGGVAEASSTTGTPPASPYDAPSIANAGSDEAAQRLWEAATVRHDEVLRAYGTYELKPDLMLRYPAVTDVTLAPVQDFHDALSDAQTLRTDTYPGSRDIADTYQQKVKALSRAWIACETNGRKVGTDYLGKAEQDGLDTALKLVNHARGAATPQEEATYYQRAHRIVAELRDSGAIHPPAGAVAQLEASARRALRAGTSST